MKKYFSIFISLLMIVILCSCKSEEKDLISSQSPKSNIESYAKKGRLDTVELKLGDSLEKVIKYYKMTLEELESPENTSKTSSNDTDTSEETSFEDSDDFSLPPPLVMDGDVIIRLKAETTQYFYDSKTPQNGIIMIAHFDDVFMLTAGAASPDVVKAMIGKPSSEDNIDENAWFFLPDKSIPENSNHITYNFGDYRAEFFFINDELLCVTLCNPVLWEAANAISSSEVSSLAG